jgi:hypothetical protein
MAAARVLVELMRDKKQPGSVRLAAATAVWDRAYGKPTQPIAGEGDGPIVVHVLTLTDPSEGRAPLPEPQPQRNGSPQPVDFHEVSSRELRGGPSVHIAGVRSR